MRAESGEMFKVRLSAAEFCKVPIREIVKVDGTRHHLIEISKPTSIDQKMNLCENTSSSPQISSSTNGDGVVSLRTGSCNLPTQVGVDNAGNVRRDFPFDGKTLTMKEKKVLSSTTLVVTSTTKAAASTTKKDAADTSATSTDTSSDKSHVFGVTAAQHLAAKMANMALAKGKFSEDLFSDSDQKLFPTNNSTIGSDYGQNDSDDKVPLAGNHGDTDVVDVQFEIRNSLSEDATVCEEKQNTAVDSEYVVNAPGVGDALETTCEEDQNTTMDSEPTNEEKKEGGDNIVSAPDGPNEVNNNTCEGETTGATTTANEESHYAAEDASKETTCDAAEEVSEETTLDDVTEVSGETTRDDAEDASKETTHDDAKEVSEETTLDDVTEVSGETTRDDAKDASKETTHDAAEEVSEETTRDDATDEENNERIKSGNNKAYMNARTMVSGGEGSTGSQKTITILVHTNIQGVIEKVSKNFNAYQRKIKRPGVEIKLHPIVTLAPLEREPKKKIVTNSSVTSEPTPTTHRAQETQTDYTCNMMDSVVPDESKAKNVKVYVDENLVLEQFLIKSARTPAPTKGKELSEYSIYLFFPLHSKVTNFHMQLL